ncbi:MAG: domain containing protein [Frankiales bacterium]|jgi:pSer/pThr/pTyr-binding forkhead associated (FHA) protein|nr:domain containing protein [Frankiales bacterium]
MGSALVVAVLKYGLLALLWVFVLLAIRTIRVDLSGKTPAVPQPAAAPATKAAKQPKPQRRKGVPRRLVVTEGSLQGTTVTLADAPVTLGRAHDSTLVLTDDYASNKHARLVPTADGWTLEDLGSTNGTYCDTGRGSAKVTRPTLVPVGSAIRIGKTVLELRS